MLFVYLLMSPPQGKRGGSMFAYRFSAKSMRLIQTSRPYLTPGSRDANIIRCFCHLIKWTTDQNKIVKIGKKSATGKWIFLSGNKEIF